MSVYMGRARMFDNRIVKVLDGAGPKPARRQVRDSKSTLTLDQLEKILNKEPMTLAELNRRNAEFWRNRK